MKSKIQDGNIYIYSFIGWKRSKKELRSTQSTFAILTVTVDVYIQAILKKWTDISCGI